VQREQLEQSYRQRLMRLEPQGTNDSLPGDVFLAKLLDVMDKQMDNNTLTVDELVDEMGMGRTVFFNKLKSMTGLSPVEFIREMRIKKAAQLLEDRQYNITEVTYMVGMNDSRYFAKCFKNTYGVTPSEYRKAALEKNG
jgi:AraC-like DNA-binding protein